MTDLTDNNMELLTNLSDTTQESDMDDDGGFTTVSHDRKRRKTYTSPENRPTTSKEHRTDTNIQRQIAETVAALGVNKQTTNWDLVISSPQTLKQSLIDEAISRYCTQLIITKSKLTASKHSIFYTFENPQHAFNTIHKHIDEISKAINIKLKVDVWRTEPPTRTTENEPTHCVARDIPLDYSDKQIFDRIEPTLKEQIMRVGRIKTGIEGKPTNFVRIICRDTDTTQHLLKFGLLLGNRKFPVVPAKPAHKVLQCYNCQLFGHHAQDCRQATYCGGSHKTRDCTLTPKTGKAHCANCQQPHPAYSAACIAYRQEVEKKKQQQQEQIKKQENLVRSAVGTGTWANIVQKQTEQTTTQIQKITTDNLVETKKLIAENETNIKTTISETLTDLKTQMTTMIQQEVKKMFAEVIQQVRTELTSALKEVKQQMLSTIREQIHNDITAIRESHRSHLTSKHKSEPPPRKQWTQQSKP